MKIRVKLFAVAREWAGSDCVELDVPGAATAGAAREALIMRIPNLSRFGAQLRLAVNNDFADDKTPISAECEIACIPPVSGG